MQNTLVISSAQDIVNSAAQQKTVNSQPSAENLGSAGALAANKAFAGMRKAIDQLAVEREVWENTKVLAANDHLYLLLQKCYRLYKCMEGASEEAKALRLALKDYFASKGYQYRPSSHTMNKIVRCVFSGHDEKVGKHRVSSYAIALRSALGKAISVEGLPKFLSEAGGVEALRAAAAGRASNATTPQQKALLGAQSVKVEVLGTFKHAVTAENFDIGKADQHVVLLGTWQHDGSITLRTVVEGKGAVAAALACYHSKLKTEEKKQIAAKEQALIQAAT